ncbi:ABC transporter substrate-binding protein [Rickettsiales endosymbiont of Peranema trichophorum]|uniref:ABC transporter substrate-binding protein n=1 Tax=Rickettsiales endosymbiont of Peranema trichophorum TaxID=2486577 RepID=UPI00102360E3|nr:ABC transporter substrate-binding protein [Rickettsiales endosymbiont of Peranema trichophorum]RZI47310.1 ABC transporter substrate-binding protein [Rickettsiales endosymbiont of Peranema trichophorum]
MNKRFYYLILAVVVVASMFAAYHNHPSHKLPTIAIANYGPHASLDAVIVGLKEQMRADGFIENQNVRYEMADVGFDHALIPQTVATLKAHNPKAMVVMSTPIAQFAKGKIKNIPLIYAAVTDPVDVGLLQNPQQADGNMTGSSDMQDLESLLKFAKSLLPNAKRVGLLYATSDSNDTSLVKMMKLAASKLDMSVVAIPVEQARDVPVRAQGFKNEVDLIYVGTSGPIQPTLPAISAEARKMRIPVFNVQSAAVRDGLALASFGVDYIAVGRNAGKLASAVLKGDDISNLTPLYPTAADHSGLINEKLAIEFGIEIPPGFEIVK